jgi:hypothetical protein
VRVLRVVFDNFEGKIYFPICFYGEKLSPFLRQCSTRFVGRRCMRFTTILLFVVFHLVECLLQISMPTHGSNISNYQCGKFSKIKIHPTKDLCYESSLPMPIQPYMNASIEGLSNSYKLQSFRLFFMKV